MTDTPPLGKIDWEQYNHQALWDMVETANPRELSSRAYDLEKLANAMGKNADEAYRSMQKLLSVWSGQAAEQSAAVVQPLLNWAAGAADTGSQIAHRLGSYAEALSQTRSEMPAPVDYRQLDAVEDGNAVTVGDPEMNEPELAAMAEHKTANAAQAAAAKAKAVAVMRRFEQQSVAIYHGMPTFTAPPKVGKLPPPLEPAPEPPSPPVVVPTRLTNPSTPGSPTAPVVPTGSNGPVAGGQDSTTPSDYLGAAGVGANLGAPAPGTGAVFGAGSALPGTGAGSGGVIGLLGSGLGPGAAAGEMAEESAGRTAASLAAEEAQQGALGEVAPMGMGGRNGNRDGEHRDRFALKADLVGDLPAAFPPVLGL